MVRVAYIILAHKLPEQLARLVTTLSSENSYFFIHIDKKFEPAFAKAKELLLAKNVYFVEPRYRCRWGQFGVIRATIASLEMLQASNVGFEYVFLLSGQDYPIKAISCIDSFLEGNIGKQFINYFPLNQNNIWTNQDGPYQAMSRIEDWHFPFRSKWIHLPLKRALPNNCLPYGGSQWWTLSSDCIEWVTKFLQENPQFLNFFKYTFIPDELFFQMIILNSPFKASVVNNNLRYIDFSRANPTPPAVFLQEDAEFLLNRTDALFARKFDTTRDSEILDLIDRNISAPVGRLEC